MNIARIIGALLGTFLLAAGTAAAGEAGTALKTDGLMAEPFRDAQTVGSLAAGDSVEILKKQGGWIINIASLAGKNAFPTAAAYNASKFGLVGFSEALMQEVRYDNIRVSYIMPGSVNTDFGGDPPSESKAWQLQPEDVAQTILDLLRHPARSLPSRVELRPSKPPKK